MPRLLAAHDGFAGVRVDHVDGLADPRAYLEGLRRLIGDDRWLLVEKILAPGERLPEAWPVDGTTGYEHAAVLEHALLDADGWDLLRRRWVAETGDRRPFRDWELDARREVLAAGLRPDLERVARVAADRLDADEDTVEAAVAELSVHLDRYRTYLPDDEGDPALTLALAEAAASQPRLAPVLARLVTELRDSDDAEAVEWRTRWQQLTGPATAKGVEDRAFWRYVTLASLDEVGGFAEPLDDVDPVAALHEHHAETAARWPTTLLAGTTHDTKRSEDVRAAGLALAARSRRFVELVDEWFDGPGSRFAIDLSIQWLALQTVVTTPGLDGTRLSRSSSRPAARPTCTRRGPTRTNRTSASSAGSPTCCCSGRPAAELQARARRAGPGGDAGDARRAVDGAGRRRHLPGHRGVPVPARRPRQPHRRPTTTRSTSWSLASDSSAEPGSPVGSGGDDPARPAGASRARPRRLPATARRRAARRLRPSRSCRRAGAGDDRAEGGRAATRPHRRAAARRRGVTCSSTTNPTPPASSHVDDALDAFPAVVLVRR